MDVESFCEELLHSGYSCAAHAPTGDLIALGAGKPALPDADTKRSASPQPSAVRKLPVLGERKRDGPSLLLAASAAKKPKLGSSFTPLGRGFGEADRRGSPATVSVVPILDESGISGAFLKIIISLGKIMYFTSHFSVVGILDESRILGAFVSAITFVAVIVNVCL